MKIPKAEQVYEQLKREIGDQPPGARVGSIRALMKQCQTSQLSLTKALRQLEEEGLIGRSESGELFIRGSIDDIGKPRVAIWVPDWPSPGYMEFEEEFRNQALQREMVVSRVSYPLNYSFRHLETAGFAAMVVIPDRILTPDMVYCLGTAPVPVVLVGLTLEDVELNFVSTNAYQGGILAASYLYQKGHRKLAVAISEPLNSVIERRRDGFITFAQAAGCRVEVIDCEVRNGENSPQKTYEVLLERFRQHRPDFTGIYVLSGMTSFSAVSALAECGVQVPRDVSVISADNLKQAAYFLPALTCVDADLADYVGKVLDVIQRLRREPGAHCRESVKSFVLERASVRDFNN